MSLSQALSRNEHAVRTVSLKQRLFPICYLGAVAVAMVGWLWAIGWVTFAVAKWMLA